MVISGTIYGQDCDCQSNFEWTKKTFEENDAGFQYIIANKGQQAYDIHNMLFTDKIKAVDKLEDCTRLLYEWLTFFRSGHIGIELLKYDEYNNNKINTPETHYETFDINISEFEKYINEKKEADFEGIWETGAYKIGIKRNGDDYIGFIISSAADTWKEKQIKLRITKDKDTFQSVFYLRDHSPEETGKPELLGNNYLEIGRHILNRLSPSFPQDKEVEDYMKLLSTQEPYLDEINESTLLLVIPSFDFSQKTAIDSVILTNKERILRTKNLIIDLRWNGGGSDQCFEEIIPFLYTNPIRTVGVEFLSTKLNNQMMSEAADIESGFNEDTRNWAKEAYDKMEKHLNEFVNIFPDVLDITEQDTVYMYPKNIGIIINEGNASTTEQFLLAAKQSKKVKLFGTTTYGALDVSNLNGVESPCEEFKLWYCTSKSYRIPDMAIDDIGIQPDFFIDKSIPEYKWVEFITDILK
jgi:hypothetical protein